MGCFCQRVSCQQHSACLTNSISCTLANTLKSAGAAASTRVPADGLAATPFWCLCSQDILCFLKCLHVHFVCWHHIASRDVAKAGSNCVVSSSTTSVCIPRCWPHTTKGFDELVAALLSHSPFPPPTLPCHTHPPTTTTTQPGPCWVMRAPLPLC